MPDKTGEWTRLVEEIMMCRKCPLHETRTRPVPGEGSLDAEIMFVGEAPGRREDETGRPFVGAAGRLLSELLGSIGLRREDVFITNIVKCRPPGNRDPREEEIAACSPYLIRQIRLIKPRIIVALGRHSGRFLFTQAGLRWAPLSAIHGKTYTVTIAGVTARLVATYHPAAALYNPRLRGVLEEDFKKIQSLLRDRGGERGQRSLFDYM